jgi:hypothetical protein
MNMQKSFLPYISLHYPLQMVGATRGAENANEQMQSFVVWYKIRNRKAQLGRTVNKNPTISMKQCSNAFLQDVRVGQPAKKSPALIEPEGPQEAASGP